MDKKWMTVIDADRGLFDFRLKEIWKYRDLCLTFIRKNYITKYKQTMFAPVYMVLSPILTSGIFSIVFGLIAGISTDGTPEFLFYMLGNLLWNYFASILNDNSEIFIGNAYVMGKVYFPRLIIPISNSLTRLISLLAQTLMFLAIYIIFAFSGYELAINIWIIIVPVLIIMLVLMGIGIGLIISSLTVKYRDLNIVLGIVMNLWMYATPIIYPMSNLSANWQRIAFLNPLAAPVEAVRYAFFDTGIISIPYLIWSTVFTVVIFLIGLVLFNQVEKDFIDTV